MKAVDEMTPRELLVLWTRMGIIATHVNRSAGHLAPAKGERALKRSARKRRRREYARRMQRVAWCAFGAARRKEVQA